MTLATTLSITDLLDQWFGTDTVIIECRNCGASLDEHAESCPQCGNEETVRYEGLE